jgi:hypothetical protein
MQTLTQFDVLRMAYDEAFERLRIEMGLLKSYDGDGVAIVHRRVTAAEAAYRQSRDELAQFLMDRQAGAEEDERRSPCLYGCG